MSSDDSIPELSNGTLYSLKSEGLRHAMTCFHIVVLLSSLAGETIILVASIKYRAFKLHRLISVIVQHIAVCDLLVCLTVVLPKVISLIADRWVLGDTLCHVTAFSLYYFNVVSVLLVCAMSTSKLVIIRFPLRLRLLTNSTGHGIMVGIWTAVLLTQGPLMVLSAVKNDIIFDFRIYACKYAWTSGFWSWLRPLYVSLMMALPNLVVVATIFPLLVYLMRARRAAKKSGGTRRWQGIMTTFLTVAIYCISYVPYAVYAFIEKTGASFVDDPHSFFQTHYSRLVASFIFLNTFTNFYIYVWTVPSFRRFLMIRLCGKSHDTALCRGNALNKLNHNRVKIRATT